MNIQFEFFGMYSTDDDSNEESYFRSLTENHMHEDTQHIVRSSRGEAHNFTDFCFTELDDEKVYTEVKLPTSEDWLDEITLEELDDFTEEEQNWIFETSE